MKFSSVSVIVCIAIMLYASTSKITASVISCPPNSFQQEMYPKINQLCGVIQQALSDMAPQNDGYLPAGLINDRNAKRQDVDHVFLRFGKRFGM